MERTRLEPGVIELTVRNDGPGRRARSPRSSSTTRSPLHGGEEPIGRLAAATLRIRQPWVEGEAYEVQLVTSQRRHDRPRDPRRGRHAGGRPSFYGLLALLGVYVGVIPIAIGMLWLPWIRRMPPRVLRVVMAVTVGLLAFLAVDATLEGLELAGEGSQAFGGAALVLLGAAVAFLALTASARGWTTRGAGGAPAARLALLVAVGIGLHNLGEGLVIGTAYATGALALGAFLVVGFALHNATEGLAIVAPIAHERAVAAPPRRARPARRRARRCRRLARGVRADAGVSAVLFGVGAGAIVQVIAQLVPRCATAAAGRCIPRAVGGVLGGMAVMFATGLLVDRAAGPEPPAV